MSLVAIITTGLKYSQKDNTFLTSSQRRSNYKHYNAQLVCVHKAAFLTNLKLRLVTTTALKIVGYLKYCYLVITHQMTDDLKFCRILIRRDYYTIKYEKKEHLSAEDVKEKLHAKD